MECPFVKYTQKGIFATIWRKSKEIFRRKHPMERNFHGMERPIHGMETEIQGMDRPRHLFPPRFPTLKGGQRWPSALTVCHIAHKALRRGGIPAAPPKAHREASAPIGGELLITAGRPQAHPRSREAADRQKLTAEKPPPTRRCAPLRHPPLLFTENPSFPFPLLSPCTPLAPPKVGGGSEEKKKNTFSFSSSLALHYLCTAAENFAANFHRHI